MKFGIDPPVMAGIDPLREPWLAWQIRSLVDAWGSWFQAQRDATKEVPVPKDQKPKMRLPLYSERQLKAMLGLAESEAAPLGWRIDGRTYAEADIDRMAREVLREVSDDGGDGGE